jgi:hypothetical protein
MLTGASSICKRGHALSGRCISRCAIWERAALAAQYFRQINSLEHVCAASAAHTCTKLVLRAPFAFLGQAIGTSK